MLSKFKCNPELDKKVPDFDALTSEEKERVIKNMTGDERTAWMIENANKLFEND